MRLLHSNIPPINLEPNQQSIADAIREQFAKADKVEIAVGYVSKKSLKELYRLVIENKISHINLFIGMYYSNGIPEDQYNLAVTINNEWMKDNHGEIRIITPFDFHGKLFCFYKNNHPISCIVGSANLSILEPDKELFEVCIYNEDLTECKLTSDTIQNLYSEELSTNISTMKNVNLRKNEHCMSLSKKKKVTYSDEMQQWLEEHNIKLTYLTPNEIKYYKNNFSHNPAFKLKLKVPTFATRLKGPKKECKQSNINVCYANGRIRDWYEAQLTVNKDIRQGREDYPANKDFFVLTDDGLFNKARITSDNDKQLSFIDELKPLKDGKQQTNDKILGYWLKKRLVEAGLISPIPIVKEDTKRLGCITQEILKEYGRTDLIFRQTTLKEKDKDGKELDVWYLSFDPNEE